MVLGLERIGEIMDARKAKSAEGKRVAARRKEIAEQLNLDKARLGISTQEVPVSLGGSRVGRQITRTRAGRETASPMVFTATQGYTEGYQAGADEGKKLADERHAREKQIAKDAQETLIGQMRSAREEQVRQFREAADLFGHRTDHRTDQEPIRIILESDIRNGRGGGR